MMDIAKIKLGLLDWLAQLKFPPYEGLNGWDDCIREFAVKEDEPRGGLRIRLALRLHTGQNCYLLSIMECPDSGSPDVHILTAHVNWKQQEWQIQRVLDDSYGHGFKDMLKAKHTVWAQTFRDYELHEALNAAAIAILGNELVGGDHPDKPKEHLKPLVTQKASFPKPETD